MAEVSSPPVACPSCGTRYRWRDEFAGKELHCKCGTSFRVSGVSGAAPPPAAPPPNLSRHGLIGPGTSAVQRALESREGEAQPSRLRNLYLPIILLPVGVAAQFVLWTRLVGDPTTGAAVSAGALLVQGVVFCPAMFAAVVTTARWFEFALGNVFTVTFKIAALTLGAAGICDVIFTQIMVTTDFDHWSLVAGYGVYLVAFGLPTLLLLEIEVHEAALITLMIFIPRVMAIYLTALALPDVFR